MKEDKNILNQFKKNKSPKVPRDFFDNFADDVMSKIEKDESVLDALKKRQQPSVPKDFFNNFADSLPIDDKKKTKIISLKNIVIVTAIAASFLLLFVLNTNTQNSNVAKDEQSIPKSQKLSGSTQTIEMNQDDEYLAYLSEDDMIDFIVDNQIDENIVDLSDGEDDLFDEVESEIEDYYYEL